MKSNGIVSLELLKQILLYDPETGIWTYRIRRGRCLPGMAAGSLDVHGYMILYVNGRRCRSGRLAWFYMTGVWPAVNVDHKDLDRKNDRWANLRLATNSQNMANKPVQSNNSLGVKGVRYEPSCRNRPYIACIGRGGRSRYLGAFSTVEEASAAYLRAARESFGDFARV